MPPTPDNLAALAAADIAAATQALVNGGSVAAWERAMAAAITRAQTAAFIAATAQRLGVPADSPLISRQRLSRAERADIQKAIADQLRYLAGFVADVRAERLSPAQIAARAMLYAGAVRAPYYAARWGAWDIPARLLPGNQTCLGNCRCTLAGVEDNGDGTGTLTRVMGGEQHCGECPPLAGQHTVRRRDAAVKHGSHNQASHGRRGRAGRAGRAAYVAARANGASHRDALSRGREATAAERSTMRTEARETRKARLLAQAQRARAAASGGQTTEAQRASLLRKAERLEASAYAGPTARPVPTMNSGFVPTAQTEPYGQRAEMRDVKRRTPEYQRAAQDMIDDLNQTWRQPGMSKPLRLSEEGGRRATTPYGVIRARNGEILAYFYNDVVTINAYTDGRALYPHLNVVGIEGLTYTTRGPDGRRISYEVDAGGDIYIHD